MTQDRKTFEGELCVYRESVMGDYLSAIVHISNAEELYYWKAPKCFDNVITDGIKNRARVRFTANLDGTNPRCVKVIGKPYRKRNRRRITTEKST
jgi:hypothetical protein